MKFQLVSNDQLQMTFILDKIIHRIIKKDTEISITPGYSVVLSYNMHTHDHYLTVTQAPQSPNPIVLPIKCNHVQMPGNISVPILKSANSNQVPTDLDPDSHRVINTGVDISSDTGVHATFVTDAAGGVTQDYLIVHAQSTLYKVAVGGTGLKIPPNTGIDF
jgi:hypothetical protein